LQEPHRPCASNLDVVVVIVVVVVVVGVAVVVVLVQRDKSVGRLEIKSFQV
jgi:preprotein translocase subunit SecG